MAKCLTPFGVRDPKNPGTTIPVPCGKCPACVARKTSEWSFRLMQEDKRSVIPARFVTLTYAPEHVDHLLTPNGYLSLSKIDLQKFFKRLRHYSPYYPRIKYYAVGEYGSENFRPHYHIILFNSDPDNVLAAWQMGSVFFGTVTAASCGYTLKYISKKTFRKKHSRDDRLPEFSLMSKGLGANYLTESMIRWHEADMYNRMYCNIEDGKKISMPRYYKNRIYTDEQRQHIGAHLASRLEDELQKAIAEYDGDYSWDKLQNDKAAFDRMLAKSKAGLKL